MRYQLVASMVLSAACVSYTSAQSEPAPSPPSQDFATVKAHHLARLQQEIACVQAAASLDALRACRPQPPGGHAGPPPGDAPFGAGACPMEFHRPGPPMGLQFGAPHSPPFLMDVSLTEDQQDKVFAILHAVEPALREQEKTVRKAHDGLRNLSRTAQFDAGRAAALAQELGKAESQLALLRVRADHDVFAVLSSEQKTEISRLESESESSRTTEHPAPR